MCAEIFLEELLQKLGVRGPYLSDLGSDMCYTRDRCRSCLAWIRE